MTYLRLIKGEKPEPNPDGSTIIDASGPVLTPEYLDRVHFMMKHGSHLILVKDEPCE